MRTSQLILGIGILIFTSACSNHDAELEKDLNSKIDHYAKTTMEFCDCVAQNSEDCEEKYSNANAAYDDMQKLYDLESEQNLDPDKYSEMMESATMSNKDLTECRKVMNSRK